MDRSRSIPCFKIQRREGLAIGALATGADGNIWFVAGSNLTTNNNELVVG